MAAPFFAQPPPPSPLAEVTPQPLVDIEVHPQTPPLDKLDAVLLPFATAGSAPAPPQPPQPFFAPSLPKPTQPMALESGSSPSQSQSPRSPLYSSTSLHRTAFFFDARPPAAAAAATNPPRALQPPPASRLPSSSSVPALSTFANEDDGAFLGIKDLAPPHQPTRTTSSVVLPGRAKYYSSVRSEKRISPSDAWTCFIFSNPLPNERSNS